ncbi:immunoglobulin-like domain-containing protein [Thermococcus thermotolerans]|uniref:immunoglobulin-like domain-containing protein n=1 Tax=Thermococcus thermotolerans TaxID=2969672 RepID=UPI0021585EDA|nr:immunoglobulin-like domain-containing protein [Thermococcus thermotolerans]
MRIKVFLGLFIFFIGITVALYAGLGANMESSPGEARAILELDKTVYKPGEDLILTIRNTGSETLLVGASYRLYHLEEGKWKEIELGFTFTGIGYSIEPRKNWSQAVQLAVLRSGELEPLPPGRYRIEKTVIIDRGRCGSRSDEIRLSSGFEVVG